MGLADSRLDLLRSKRRASCATSWCVTSMAQTQIALTALHGMHTAAPWTPTKQIKLLWPRL